MIMRIFLILIRIFLKIINFFNRVNVINREIQKTIFNKYIFINNKIL